MRESRSSWSYALLRARHVGHGLGQQLQPEDAAAQRAAGQVDDRLAQVGQGLLRVADAFAGGVDADERLLDDVLAGGRVVEEQRGEAQQRAVVRAVGLGEVVDRGAGHRLVGAVTLTGDAGGPRCGHGRDHRHATGRAGHAGPERAARRPERRATGRCEVEYLCHASWTRFPRKGCTCRASRLRRPVPSTAHPRRAAPPTAHRMPSCVPLFPCVSYVRTSPRPAPDVPTSEKAASPSPG